MLRRSPSLIKRTKSERFSFNSKTFRGTSLRLIRIFIFKLKETVKEVGLLDYLLSLFLLHILLTVVS